MTSEEFYSEISRILKLEPNFKVKKGDRVRKIYPSVDCGPIDIMKSRKEIGF